MKTLKRSGLNTEVRRKVLLLVSGFNSLTQQVFCLLRDMGHDVCVEFAGSETVMLEAVNSFGPELILCPYLMQKVPESIWRKIPVVIIHPGPPGDRGPSSLDWAILKNRRRWGVTLLQANEEMDAGDLWVWEEFEMNEAPKGRIYRREVGTSAILSVKRIFEYLESPNFTPLPQDRLEGIEWHIHRPVCQDDRSINWNEDDSASIVRKIHSADNHPGVLDEILGIPCYLYGAHFESQLRGLPKEILAKRNGAICLGTVDGAVWISHLREPHRFKLPASYVLKDRLKGIREKRIPLYVSPEMKTFKEITFEKRDNIGYLGFDFYNGAMSSEQCIRLKYAIESIREEVDILVLLGGKSFFSNGIHLTILEDSKKQGEDGWSNINAMNNLIRTILFSENTITVASFEANAGAGGVFLGLACDFVIARDGVVLNPHYKTIGLSGSEYHTYTLPRRTGEETAERLISESLPISATNAADLGVVDKLFPSENYSEDLHKWCMDLLKNDDRYFDILERKTERLEADEALMERCKERELERMYPEFWDPDSDFHRLRHEFVYKICPTKAPERLRGKS